jgi:hypothetical protein
METEYLLFGLALKANVESVPENFQMDLSL